MRVFHIWTMSAKNAFVFAPRWAGSDQVSASIVIFGHVGLIIVNGLHTTVGVKL